MRGKIDTKTNLNVTPHPAAAHPKGGGSAAAGQDDDRGDGGVFSGRHLPLWELQLVQHTHVGMGWDNFCH